METQNAQTTALKQFGIFVGFFNRINNTQYSVKEAAKDPTIVEFYNKVSQTALVVNTKVKAPQKKSTKRRAYDILNIPKIDNTILEYIHSNQDQSREDIANGTGLKLATVCGSVNRMIEAKIIFVSGEKTSDSNRSVETLGSLYIV